MVQDGTLSAQDYKRVLNCVSIPPHPVTPSVTSIVNSGHISPEPAPLRGPFGLRKASFLSAYSGFQAQAEKTIFIVRGEGEGGQNGGGRSGDTLLPISTSPPRQVRGGCVFTAHPEKKKNYPTGL